MVEQGDIITLIQSRSREYGESVSERSENLVEILFDHKPFLVSSDGLQPRYDEKEKR